MKTLGEFFHNSWKVLLVLVVVVAVILMTVGFFSARNVVAQTTTDLDVVTAERDVLALQVGELQTAVQTSVDEKSALQVQIDQLVAEKAKAVSDQAALQIAAQDAIAQRDALKSQLDAIAEAEVAKAEAAAAAQAAKEPVTQDEVYAQEIAKFAVEPNYHRGENPAKGVTISVPANSQSVNFAGHAQIAIKGQIVNVPWQSATENLFLLINNSSDQADFTVTGFPDTGFSTWIYRPGLSAEYRKLAALSVGNPTHCGLTNGCEKAYIYVLTWDGNALSYTTEEIKDEFNLTFAAAPVPSIDWTTLSATDGVYAMRKLLGQPASVISVNDISLPVRLGVTAGKDHLIVLPAGSKVIGPDGISQDFVEPATVILSNAGSDTVVYEVWLTASGTIAHEEYRYGFNVADTVPVLLKALTEMPTAFGLTAAPAEPSVFVATFDGSTVFDQLK
ncbi:hypothetical protein GYA27_01240 [candidate division WWE3 bacterium]|uniref:Uncharacterized protein n=1 Tax=candidate division WWE3 bacterium TaxID=2053526 RepID=A0A7X9DJY0_UNCKA|nr:hypothetical protein [candidate division WWE3 bacterium]